MKLNDYSNLKEIHSLDNMIKVHLDKIKEEESRIDFIVQKRKQKDQDLKEFEDKEKSIQDELNQMEVKLFDLEKKLNTSKEHLPLASNQKEATALENTIMTLTPQVDQLQEESLEKLEELELLEEEKKKTEGFLKGSLNTLKEIEEEVSEIRKTENIPIGQYEKRIQLLLKDTQPHLVSTFLSIREKFRYKRPLVRVINNTCEFCHFHIDQMAQDRLETFQSIETCSQCSRLFIPLEA